MPFNTIVLSVLKATGYSTRDQGGFQNIGKITRKRSSKEVLSPYLFLPPSGNVRITAFGLWRVWRVTSNENTQYSIQIMINHWPPYLWRSVWSTYIPTTLALQFRWHLYTMNAIHLTIYSLRILLGAPRGCFEDKTFVSLSSVTGLRFISTIPLLFNVYYDIIINPLFEPLVSYLTLTDSSIKRRTTASPMPVAAPVIITTFFSNWYTMFLCCLVRTN